MSVETAILRALFPEGFAPIERLPEIQKAIGNLIRISQGNVKISDPEVNRILNSKIIKGKDQDHKTWVQIQEELRTENIFLTVDAIRHRYSGAKREAREAKVEKTVGQKESGTSYDFYWAENDNILLQDQDADPVANAPTVLVGGVQAIDKKLETPEVWAMPAEGPAQVAAIPESKFLPEAKVKKDGAEVGPKIPHSFDQFILEQHNKGVKTREIFNYLVSKGVKCKPQDLSNRMLRLQSKDDEPKARPQEPAPRPAQVPAVKLPSTEASRHKELSDKEINNIVSDWHEGGATNFEISRRLEHDYYVTFTPMEIGQRIQGLRRRGAICYLDRDHSTILRGLLNDPK